MIDLKRRLCASAPAGRMLHQVHDELVLELPLAELEAARDLGRDCMQGAAHLSVPLWVDFGRGRIGLDAH